MQEVTKEDMKQNETSYFLASWEDNQLVLEPYCFCGEMLEENFFCPRCRENRAIDVILCREFKIVGIVEKFIHGNPQFKDFRAYLLKASQNP